uniref:RNase H type-1 domain-containing protein n=1 Tax=Cannabis sativa TaxID=3483 RepID=A0A803Q554_CANSA
MFETASGQQVNASKSNIFFTPNSAPQHRDSICNILGMIEASEGSHYLGLPNIIGWNKNTILGFIKNKVITRLNSWHDKFLSRANKEILFKIVVQLLPTYAISVFLIPIGTCQEIEKLMAQFWWKTNASKELGSNPNFVWRSIWGAQKLIKLGANRTIKSGTTTTILNHSWLPDNDQSYVTTNNPGLINQPISSLFSVESDSWDYDLVCDMFNSRDASLILGLPLSTTDADDCWSLTSETNGSFTLKIPPKVKNMLWRILNNCLPTCLNLVTKHVNVSILCPMCLSQPENTTYALLHCALAAECWNRLGINRPTPIATFASWLEHVFSTMPTEDVCKIIMQRGQPREEARWTPPRRDSFKINVDAGVKVGEGIAGLSSVVRDDEGRVVAAANRYVQKNIMPLQEELQAILMGLQAGIQRSLPSFSVESDCLQAVHLVMHEKEGCRDVDGLIAQIK